MTYVNLSALQDEWTHIKKIIGQTNQVCNHILNKTRSYTKYPSAQFSNMSVEEYTTCGPIQQQITYLTTQIEEYNVEHFQDTKIRRKRGFLNIVGELAKDLFGTLSESDSQQYQKQFEHLLTTNSIRDEISQKQSTLIQSTFNLLTETRAEAANNDKQINAQIYKIENHLNQFSKYVDDFLYLTQLNIFSQGLLMFVMLLITSFKEKQMKFLEALSLGTKGGNSPIIIPPNVFYRELSAIRNALSGRAIDLPLTLSKETLPLFYQIASPRSSLRNNQLIIVLTIPLTDMEQYNLYKVTSFPFHMHDNIYQFIVPTHEYIAISRYSQRYVAFTNQELANCHSTFLPTNQSILTCMELKPIMDVSPSRDDCEITLLTKDLISQNCDIRVANVTSEIWIKIREHNSWIYVLPSNTMVRIDCLGSDIQNLLINGTGILSIHEDCNIKTDNILIQAFKIYQNEILLEAIPYGKINVNVSRIMNDIVKFPEIHLKTISSPSVISFGQSHKLKELSTGIRDLMQLEQDLSSKHTPTALRQSLNALNIFIICIFALIVFMILRSTLKNRRRRQDLQKYAKRVVAFTNKKQNLPTPFPTVPQVTNIHTPSKLHNTQSETLTTPITSNIYPPLNNTHNSQTPVPKTNNNPMVANDNST